MSSIPSTPPGDPTPLHELNPIGRFSDRVCDYVRFRPSYPAPAVNRVLAGLGDPLTITAADIGAGTGISAVLLAERGVTVHAVEPNEAMRRAIPASARVIPVDGAAEATTLPEHSVSLVLCAQAFHWFDVPKALAEFARILRRPGRLALVWNKRDPGDAFTRVYTDAIRAVATEKHVEMMPFDPAVVENSSVFGHVAAFEYPNAQRLDRAGLIGRAVSASYVPKSGPGYDTLVKLLSAAHRLHANPSGMVELRYITQVFLSAPI